MLVWLLLVAGSILVGSLVAWFVPSKHSLWIAPLTAWSLFLAWLLFNEYVLPYQGGGASMWPVAQLFGGTAAAIVAFLSCLMVRARKH